MRIDDKRKYIHIHIPRTGGTSLTRIMDAKPVRGEHTKLSDIDFGGRLKTHRVVTFVRNPWAWEYSKWAHSHSKGKAWTWDEYIDHRIQTPILQSDYVTTKAGIRRFDWVGRFETYMTDALRFMKDFELKGILPHLRYMNKPDYRSKYTTWQIDVIAEIHKRDIEIFEWEF